MSKRFDMISIHFMEKSAIYDFTFSMNHVAIAI